MSGMHNIEGRLAGTGESGPAHQKLLPHEELFDRVRCGQVCRRVEGRVMLCAYASVVLPQD